MRRTSRGLERLLWVYPKTYREHRGEEILGTLLESAPARSTFETLRVAGDLAAHGLRLRLGAAPDQAGGKVLGAAALPGMTTAAAAAVVMVFFAQLLPGIHHDPTSFGPDTVIWPALHAVWILGAVVTLAVPRRTRACALTCVTTTLVVGFVLPPRIGYLPSDFALFIALAIPALLAQRVTPRRSERWLALLVSLAVLAVLGYAAANSPPATFGGPGFYGALGVFAPYVAAAAVTLFCCSFLFLTARRWTYGMGLLLLSVPCIAYQSAVEGAFQQPTATIWHGTMGRLPVMVVAAVILVLIELTFALGVALVGKWFSRIPNMPGAVH